MSGNNFNGAHLNPDAPIFEGSKTLPVPEIKQLTQIIANQNEDIVSLKLINFEAQIEINKKVISQHHRQEMTQGNPLV